jgi:hypothetical protein
MMTPFEQSVQRCINNYQRLRAVHPDLDRAAREFTSTHWFVAFDEYGHLVGAVRAEGTRQLIASESSVRIEKKEWR